MPRKRSPAANRVEGPPEDPSARHLQRIANLLAVIAVKDMERNDQVYTLLSAGFSHSETAALLRLSPSAVRGIVFRNRE